MREEAKAACVFSSADGADNRVLYQEADSTEAERAKKGLRASKYPKKGGTCDYKSDVESESFWDGGQGQMLS